MMEEAGGMRGPQSGVTHEQGERLELVTPTLDLEAACRACEAGFAAAGEVFLGPSASDWPAFVHRCAEEAAGRPVALDRVPQTVFILTRVAPDGGRDALGVS